MQLVMFHSDDGDNDDDDDDDELSSVLQYVNYERYIFYASCWDLPTICWTEFKNKKKGTLYHDGEKNVSHFYHL